MNPKIHLLNKSIKQKLLFSKNKLRNQMLIKSFLLSVIIHLQNLKIQSKIAILRNINLKNVKAKLLKMKKFNIKISRIQ